MPFPLSLRSSQQADHETDPLFTVLRRIYIERGHLRDVTEESLEAEIKSNAENRLDTAQLNEQSGDDTVREQQSKEPPQDIESRAKELQAARVEMIQMIGQANNEALTALDFVSLLLSKDAPRQAEASISPALKSMAPTGTLGFDKTEASKPTASDQELGKKEALGLNFDSLNSSADKLLDAATRLEQEISRETNFWEQILSVSEKGWNLCRMPGRNHNVGVRFGFSEASPRFRTRGLAPLKPDQDGGVFLDQAISEEKKLMRIRVVEAGVILETSCNQPPTHSNSSSLDSVVQQARNSLFDEELFFNLLIDARDLFSYGVRVIDDSIILPCGTQAQPNREVSIDLVSYDDAIHTANSLADSIALTLRIFLTNTYRARHRLRSLPPTPLATESGHTLGSNLLLPLLCHVQHYARTSELNSYLTTLGRSIRSAGLDCNVQTYRSFPAQIRIENPALKESQGTVTAMERIVSVLNATLSTTLSFSLLDSTRIFIRIKTSLSAPAFGTEFQIWQKQNDSDGNPVPITFSDYEQLTHYFNTLVCRLVTAFLSEKLQGWEVDDGGMAIKQTSSSSGIKRMKILTLNGRLALSTRKDATGSKSILLGAWDGRSQARGLLEAARQNSAD